MPRQLADLSDSTAVHSLRPTLRGRHARPHCPSFHKITRKREAQRLYQTTRKHTGTAPCRRLAAGPQLGVRRAAVVTARQVIQEVQDFPRKLPGLGTLRPRLGPTRQLLWTRRVWNEGPRHQRLT